MCGITRLLIRYPVSGRPSPLPQASVNDSQLFVQIMHKMYRWRLVEYLSSLIGATPVCAENSIFFLALFYLVVGTFAIGWKGDVSSSDRLLCIVINGVFTLPDTDAVSDTDNNGFNSNLQNCSHCTDTDSDTDYY